MCNVPLHRTTLELLLLRHRQSSGGPWAALPVLQATWPHGYWVRNMNQECYTGAHQNFYLPLGIASVLLFCAFPPAATFLLLLRHRRRRQEYHVRQLYGFLYVKYRCA